MSVIDKPPGTEVLLVPEPTNPYDSAAIKVVVDGFHIGYVPKKLTRTVDLDESYELDSIGTFHSGVFARVRRV